MEENGEEVACKLFSQSQVLQVMGLSLGQCWAEPCYLGKTGLHITETRVYWDMWLVVVHMFCIGSMFFGWPDR